MTLYYARIAVVCCLFYVYNDPYASSSVILIDAGKK